MTRRSPPGLNIVEKRRLDVSFVSPSSPLAGSQSHSDSMSGIFGTLGSLTCRVAGAAEGVLEREGQIVGRRGEEHTSFDERLLAETPRGLPHARMHHPTNSLYVLATDEWVV